ncbi:MAG: hypothetical protein ACJA01_002521 [Saprospiraceae bacterium]|jgi:hypothetical protein
MCLQANIQMTIHKRIYVLMKQRQRIFNFALYIVLIFLSQAVYAQDADSGPYKVIIESIESLESTKDPKCHATAGRLEDFMFGTPLNDEAREYRIKIQKDIIRYIWLKASDDNIEKITPQLINKISDEIYEIRVVDGNWYVSIGSGKSILIDQRDYKHYASIAYSLRAVLAVQQEDLFGDRILSRLQDASVERLKLVSDIVSIAVIKLADNIARDQDKYVIGVPEIEKAWKSISKIYNEENAPLAKNHISDYNLTMNVIEQKLKSYEEYNQLSQKVFLRNVQVYFAKTMWPKDSIESIAVTSSFQDILIEFTSQLLLNAQKKAVADDQVLIRHEDVRIALQKLLPHTINEFEDVTFFNRLEFSDQGIIEAYDLDAFRDSGIHWNYLGAAIRRSIEKLQLEPTPFSLELIVEGIAQMGVLLWREAGNNAKLNQDLALNKKHLENAFDRIKKLSIKSNATPEIEEAVIPLNSNENNSERAISNELFENVTERSGIAFEHRTSDWLSRLIRSYIVKDDENLTRLAIPPAFGGGGVAAEDINHDGYDDILFLGGHGIKLFLNNGDKTFQDRTHASGISWTRTNGTYGEARQPIITDFNNDGHPDIFISYVNDYHRIFKGNGDGTFVDMTEASNLGGVGSVAGPSTALDFDKDGWIDLYVGYFGNYIEGHLPTLKRHNDNGEANKLYRNLGNFQFEEVKNSGVENHGWTQAVGHADIDNDGWQDLIVGNDFGVNAYYLNQQDGTFEDKSIELGTNKPSYTMNIGFTDLNADDLPDFYISNIVVMEKDDKYKAPNANTTMHFNPESLANMRVVEANDLFISGRSKKKIRYTQSKAIGRGYASTGWAWDADFFDYDNDGDEDLYCLNGMNQYSVYGPDNPYYTSPDGEAMSISLYQSQASENVFFENNDGFLQNRSSGSGLNLNHTSRSAAYLDYDNDGDLDVVVNNYNGPAYFYENKAEEFDYNWVKLKLTYREKDSNPSLVGAKIKIQTDSDKHIWRQISSTTGYLSGHPSTVHVGLNRSKSYKIEIIWPDGMVTKRSLNIINSTIHVERKGNKVSF